MTFKDIYKSINNDSVTFNKYETRFLARQQKNLSLLK